MKTQLALALSMLLVTVGCDNSTHSGEPAEPTAEQPAENKVPLGVWGGQENQEPNTQKLTATDNTLSDDPIFCDRRVTCSWEGTVVINGSNGEVQSKFSMSDTTHWLDEGKSIEM